MGHGNSAELHLEKFVPSKQLKTTAVVLIAIGLLGLGYGLLKNQDGLWPAYLTAFFYVACLSLGGMFFVAINHIAKAGWSSSIRRLAEGMASFLPMILVGGLILLVGLKKLYPWARPEEVAENAVIASKTAYLNVGFFIVRLLVYGLGTLFFAKKIIGNSIAQDSNGDHKYTLNNVGWSIGYVLFFAIFFSLFSVDLIMSIMPAWYSTIFGVYCFSGMFQSSLAFLILLMIYMKKNGYIKGYYSEDHMHDVGKFLKGFTVFWAYIAFSQFMLIWYANIPEETEYYLMRAHGGWMMISMALLIFKFIVPFLALLPRGVKRNETLISIICVLILVMQYLDIHWMIYPNFDMTQVTIGFTEISMLALFVGIFLTLMIRFFSKNNLVAIKDPRLHEALHHHVSY